MSDEISLSIEETNKLRVQLGLKPIPHDSRTKIENNVERLNESYTDKEVPSVDDSDNSNGKDISFITEDKIFLLRHRLSKINQRINGNKTEHDLSNKDNQASERDWLNRVGTRHLNQNKVRLQHYSEEEEEAEEEEDGKEKDKNEDNNGINKNIGNENDELPIMRVSHDIKTLPKGSNTILTLRDTDVINNDSDNDDADILENEDLIIQEETEKNLELKKMNKDRRRHKMTLKVSSMDIDNLENDIGSKHAMNSIIIGGIIQSDENKELTASKQQQQQSGKNEEGKVRVVFDSEDEEEDGDEEMVDFRKIKIKKRTKKGVEQRSIRKRKKVELPQTMSLVQLNNDTDENEEEEEEELNSLINIMPQRNSKLKDDTDEHEIAVRIKKEQTERQERLKSINRLGSIHKQGLTVDENSSFFNLLNTNIVSNDSSTEKQTTNNKTIEDATDSNENRINQSPNKDKLSNFPNNTSVESKPKVDFYYGIASTLNFLKDHDILPKRTNDTSASNVSPTEKFNENIRTRDNVDLSHYNPEIKLEYRDAYGNVLTTKEAYKKLSQKFHGTKSNKKKQMKYNQKIIERKQHSQSK